MGQQISVKARSRCGTASKRCGKMTPANVLKLKVDDMRAAGCRRARSNTWSTSRSLRFGRGPHRRLEGQTDEISSRKWSPSVASAADGRDVPDLPPDAPETSCRWTTRPDHRVSQTTSPASGEPQRPAQVGVAWAPTAAWRLGIFGDRSTGTGRVLSSPQASALRVACANPCRGNTSGRQSGSTVFLEQIRRG